MTQRPLTALALAVATQAHRGQVDKGGAPYIMHPSRVSGMVRHAGHGDEAQAVALLHDVVEDSSWTLKDLSHVGFPQSVVLAVEALTHLAHEPREVYYRRVRMNRTAHIVKWFDIADNLKPARREGLDPATQARLLHKYMLAQVELGPPPAAL